MLTYVIRRCLWGLVVLLGVSVITFIVAFAVPTDPARLIAGPHATQSVLAQIRAAYGMNDPLPTQYVRYVWHLLHGDLGVSYSLSEGVAPAIFTALPATAMLALCGVVVELAVGVPIGVLAALWPQRPPDTLGLVFALIGFSIPPFVLGNVLLLLFAFHWTVFPLGGAGGPVSIVLPALTLGLGGAAWYSRLLRATMLDILREQYIRTALAKGVSRRRVIVKHALRNAAGPLVTQFGLDLAYFLGGVVVVESVFAWPGVGQLAYNAIVNADLNLVMGTVLVSATFVVLANIAVDVAQAWLDPRIRLS
ncbi:MAG TPA: ABC transporter permease [Chloroflexota bacterium]|jgi:peptide/nickel transport system permease protein|nr:ABC transporter permease [Chloroflexota bacterium]